MIAATAAFWQSYAICGCVWIAYAWVFLGGRTAACSAVAMVLFAALLLVGMSFLRWP